VRRPEQYNRYPSDAKSHGAEGIVMLSFSVDRNGRVLAHEIVRSSGQPVSMIERAQPVLPAFPPSMPEEKARPDGSDPIFAARTRSATQGRTIELPGTGS
jgi:TonB family protein